jgi:hypothetical protein
MIAAKVSGLDAISGIG